MDRATRDALVAADPRSSEILKPVLRGRDIARYRAKWAGLWLISAFPSLSLDIDEYPAIKQHLLSFGRARLAQEGRKLPGGDRSRKRTPHAWYELQDTCAYHESFTQEKLFWMDLTPEGRFSYVPASKEMYCANTVYFMHGSRMKFLAAFLNSSLITWYVNQTTVTSGMGTARWFAVTVENIPIPPFLENGSKLEALVDHLIVAMRDGATKQIEELELAIEQSVFQAYGVTEAERLALGKPNRIQSI